MPNPPPLLKETKMSTNAIAGLFMLLLLCVTGFGYCDNIYKLVTQDVETFTPKTAIRIAGAFIPPVGVVIGYMTLQGEK